MNHEPIRHRPHFLNPIPETVRCLITYKNFAAVRGISHIGLGVSAVNTMNVLRLNGYWVEVVAISSSKDLDDAISRINADAVAKHQVPLSHVVVSAPWIPTTEFMALTMKYPQIQFASNIHSNVGFLQADPAGVKLIREYLEMQIGNPTFHLTGNCLEFVRWIHHAYKRPCSYLPNLYDLSTVVGVPSRPLWNGGLLRIGCFGAIRPLKNHLTAAACALQIFQDIGASEMEFWMSGNRMEGNGTQTILNAIYQMYDGIIGAKVVLQPWQPWPLFKTTIGKMHLHIQASYTESFNMVVADGISQGVPSVVSSSIDWAPHTWQTDHDDVGHMAHVGKAMLRDGHGAYQGFQALQAYVRNGIHEWAQFFAK